MSAKFTFLAWDTKIDNPPLKLALLQLANNADDDGFSYYSISKMAVACGMSDRTFMRKIAELEKIGVLMVTRRSNRPSLYTLRGDEMGVTLCHLQDPEVTGCHAEVTESHLVGDRESHDPNSTPNTNPKSIYVDPVKAKKSTIDYSKVEIIYNESLPKASNIAKLTTTRKKLVKEFFDNFDLDLDKLKNYLEFISSNKNCQWMFEGRPMNDGSGRTWAKQKFEYFLSEKCYLNVKENM